MFKAIMLYPINYHSFTTLYVIAISTCPDIILEIYGVMVMPDPHAFLLYQLAWPALVLQPLIIPLQIAGSRVDPGTVCRW